MFRKLAFSFLVAFLFSVCVLAEPKTTSNVPNPVGVAQVYPSTKAIPGGAEIKATFHMKDLGSKVSWSVLAPVMEADGTQRFIEIANVDDLYQHSATDYHAERTYNLDYNKVNEMLAQKAPNAKLEIGPGTPLFVYARWMNLEHLDMYTDQPIPGRTVVSAPGKWNHQWGGIPRNGMVILPGAVPNTTVGTNFTKGGVTTALDVSNKATQFTVNQFPNAGINGQSTFGSRFENELKLHIDVNDIPKVSQFFQTLENNPALVEQTFGKGWLLKANRKYVGQPMIDEYMDDAHFNGAEKGMALRFRTGSGITSLNYKPNDGVYAGNGVYERIEYDLRGVGNPNNISLSNSFFDSTDALNPLQLIPAQIPGTVPSDFLKKQVKITDERLKYELTAPSGDQVEISVDHVKARRMGANGQETGNQAEYGQLEVEVNHLGATGSTNTSNTSTNHSYLSESRTAHGPELDAYLKNLKSGAVIQGSTPPVFHGELDFQPNSPIKTVNATNFKLAFDVFDKIRTGAFGNNWLPSGQKYAVAAAALGLLPPERFAPSVRKMVQEKLQQPEPTASDMLSCISSLVKINQMP